MRKRERDREGLRERESEGIEGKREGEKETHAGQRPLKHKWK